MKKKLVLVVVMAFSMAVSAQRNVIKTNLVKIFFFGTVNLSYERVVRDKQSIKIGFSYTDISIWNIRKHGVQVDGEYKFYFDDKTPRGWWYAAPIVSYTKIKDTNIRDLNSTFFSAFSGGVVAGYQWVFGGGNSGFVLDLNLGTQYNSVISKPSEFSDVSTFLPRFAVSIGYAW